MAFVTYLVDGRKFELVLFLVVEHEALLFNEAHDWSFTARALQERDKTVKDPVLRHANN